VLSPSLGRSPSPPNEQTARCLLRDCPGRVVPISIATRYRPPPPYRTVRQFLFKLRFPHPLNPCTHARNPSARRNACRQRVQDRQVWPLPLLTPNCWYRPSQTSNNAPGNLVVRLLFYFESIALCVSGSLPPTQLAIVHPCKHSHGRARLMHLHGSVAHYFTTRIHAFAASLGCWRLIVRAFSS
jgi:hypothetical protein